MTVLPPGCTSGCATATADGTYPGVFNNELADGSFGITSPIFLNEVTPAGLVRTLRVPDGTRPGVPGGSGVVTSFSSKSELALNQSTNGQYVTFMGYATRPNMIDVSNSNTPGVVDPTNPVPGSYYRVVATLGRNGRISYTETNAYSGNNGRAAILQRQPRRQCDLHRGERREWRQPAARRRDPRCGCADHDALGSAGERPGPRPAGSGRQLQRDPAG